MKKFTSIALMTLALATTNCIADSNTGPTKLAVSAFKKFGKSVSKLSFDCLSFVEEGPVKGESDMDVDVREKHEGKCGGDPGVAPSVARLRIKGKKVLILDPIEGEYKIFNSKYAPEY